MQTRPIVALRVLLKVYRSYDAIYELFNLDMGSHAFYKAFLISYQPLERSNTTVSQQNWVRATWRWGVYYPTLEALGGR